MVAQGADLIELVADVEDGAALLGQVAQGHEQPGDSLGREHGGGLVQDQQLGVGHQGAHDFNALALTDAEVVHRAGGVDLQAVFAGHLADAGGDLGQAHGLVQAQPDVLGHAEGVEQREVLEHHADAQGARLLR